MKSLKMKNKALVPVFTFLQNLNLKGKATRGRTQMIKRLEEKSTEFNEALKEIRLDYFKVDEAGEFVTVDGKLVDVDKTKKEEAEKKVSELNEEEFEISFGEYSTKYENLFDVLKAIEAEEEKYQDFEFVGQEAYGYNELMEAYEANEAEAEKEKVKKGTKK